MAVGNIGNICAADADRTGFRAVKPEQKPEHRAFSGSGPADERDLFALLYRQGKVAQHGLFTVSEGDMGKHDIAARRRRLLRRNDALRLGKESVDPPDAGHGRLNGLYFHAKTFDRGENAGNIVDHRHRCTDRHTEQGEDLRPAGGGEQHDDPDHRSVQ